VPRNAVVKLRVSEVVGKTWEEAMKTTYAGNGKRIRTIRSN
jgi:hypothetical protein